MSLPAVFVSSTFVDLRHVREHLKQFITRMGYIPILHEFGGVGYDFTKPLDESCYDEVSNSDIFVLIIGGRYGSVASDQEKLKVKKFSSITRKEYEKAVNSRKPVYTFVEQNVYTEYTTYLKNKSNLDVNYASVDDKQIFDFIEQIHKARKNNFVKPYSKLEDITSELTSQWASIVKRAVKQRKTRESRGDVRINSFKLFFYRHRRNYSQTTLAKNIGVDVAAYRKLEKANFYSEFTGYSVEYFPFCSRHTLTEIEKFLDAHGKLEAGQHDDFTAMFMEFYANNRGKQTNVQVAKDSPLLKFETKAVVFDFDGTITKPIDGRTSWEAIWEFLGYEINECASYHSEFRRNKISHQEWCNITLDKFQERDFSYSQMLEIASKIPIIDGLSETLTQLRSRNIKIEILSGSIRQIILSCLRNIAIEVDVIKANDIQFNPETGIISNIVGTLYDFEGKAKYMKNLVTELRCSPMDVLYIGNAGNDSWVSQSGVRTLCINPTSTDPDNAKVWWQQIRELKNMTEILPFTI